MIKPKLTTKDDKRIILISFLVDLSDIFINLFAAYLSGSVVMATQTLQGISDVSASGMTLYGLQRSQKKSDHRHPYGYGKAVYFWAAAAGIVMFTLSAGLSFVFGLQRFLNPQPIENIGVALVVLGIGLATNAYSFSQSSKRIVRGKTFRDTFQKIRRSSLVTSKIALILDFYGSLSSIVGMIALSLFAVTGNNHFDGLGAMLIALLLALLTVILLFNIKELIVGRSVDPKIEDAIKKIILEVPEVLDVLELNTLIIGPEKILADIEVHLADDLDTDQIEKITDNIKRTVKEHEPRVAHIMVEIETPDPLPNVVK